MTKNWRMVPAIDEDEALIIGAVAVSEEQYPRFLWLGADPLEQDATIRLLNSYGFSGSPADFSHSRGSPRRRYIALRLAVGGDRWLTYYPIMDTKSRLIDRAHQNRDASLARAKSLNAIHGVHA